MGTAKAECICPCYLYIYTYIYNRYTMYIYIYMYVLFRMISVWLETPACTLPVSLTFAKQEAKAGWFIFSRPSIYHPERLPHMRVSQVLEAPSAGEGYPSNMGPSWRVESHGRGTFGLGETCIWVSKTRHHSNASFALVFLTNFKQADSIWDAAFEKLISGFPQFSGRKDHV